jgi:hypothetical protein
MSDWGAVDEPVHRGGESVASVWPHRRQDGPRRFDGEEKTMRKTTPVHSEASFEDRKLTDAELDLVTGGQGGQGGGNPMAMLNQIMQQIQQMQGQG